MRQAAIGISVPLFWARLMARVIGQGPAERLCQFASLVSPQEAKQVRSMWRVLHQVKKHEVQMSNTWEEEALHLQCG